MSNKKINNLGQALVEFVIIIPIMLMLFFTLIDIARVIYTKNSLENKLSDAVLYYKNGDSKDKISTLLNTDDKEVINIFIEEKNEYTTLELKEDVKPITPGFNYIKDKYFKVSVRRVIPSE